MAGQPWTQDEVSQLARIYFRLLDEELAGEKINKHEALLRAQAVLPHRTYHTLMDRCYRISEELWKRDLPWIRGWKPPAMGNQRPNTVNMATTIWNAVEPMVEKYRDGADVAQAGAPLPGGATAGDQRGSDAIGANPDTAQAYATEAELRQAIEEVAQLRLMKHFESLGWTVEDTHLTAPYDARATKGNLTQYLEAKGTTSSGDSVFVTRGEVAWARMHPGRCVMGIVSGIERDVTGRVEPDSGVLRLVDWNPEEGDLQAIQYEWTPRG